MLLRRWEFLFCGPLRSRHGTARPPLHPGGQRRCLSPLRSPEGRVSVGNTPSQTRRSAAHIVIALGAAIAVGLLIGWTVDAYFVYPCHVITKQDAQGRFFGGYSCPGLTEFSDIHPDQDGKVYLDLRRAMLGVFHARGIAA